MRIAHHLSLTSLAALTLLSAGCGEQPSATPPTEQAADTTAAPGETEPESAEQPDDIQAPEKPESEEPTAEAGETVEVPDAEKDVVTDEDADALEDALEVPQALAPSPHKIFDHWHEVLMEQSTPEQSFSWKKGEALTEDEQEELNEIRGKALIALEAGKALYSARLAIIEGALQVPNFYLDDEELEKLLDSCKSWLADGFHRDLGTQGISEGWLPAGCVEPPLRPGRQELLFRPALETLAYSRANGGTMRLGYAYAFINSQWEARQDDFMKHLSALHGGEKMADIDPGMPAPLTRMSWQCNDDGTLTEESLRFCAAMKELIRKEDEAWKRYRKAMLALICPSRGYQGTGMGTFMSAYECHLLDSRERFICLLTNGITHPERLSHMEVLRQAELIPLYPNVGYGEIFGAKATIFRHPKLEGNPWCIRFQQMGTGFIFVKESNVLRRYLARNPQGGKVNIRGYQSLEATGKPYEMPDDDEECAPRPTNAMKFRQVFHLLECKAAPN